MADPYDGIILIDKEAGETSFGVVKRIRRTLKIGKVGHAGTLDPFATGLLIILLGQGTKLFPYLMPGDKLYRATMRLGIETDTQDLSGRVVQTRPVSQLSPEYVTEQAERFLGEIEQDPPLFSALKYKGRRAYEFARKGVQIDLEKKKVRVHSIDIISSELPDIILEVCCSSGTYVRSLAFSLGRQLGAGGHLRSLRRLSSGPFSVQDALDLSEIDPTSVYDALKERIIPLRDALPHLKEAQVDERMALKIRNGYQPQLQDVVREFVLPNPFEQYMKCAKGTELVAIMKVWKSLGSDKRRAEVVRVFH